MQELPFEKEFLKDVVGNGKIEFCLYNLRSRNGIQTWELKILNSNNTRKIIVVRDYGFQITKEEVRVKPFKTRIERNAEILRLYKDEGLSQVFLANFFGISQPSVSLIVNGK